MAGFCSILSGCTAIGVVADVALEHHIKEKQQEQRQSEIIFPAPAGTNRPIEIGDTEFGSVFTEIGLKADIEIYRSLVGEQIVRRERGKQDKKLDEIDKRDEERIKRGICNKSKNLTNHCHPPEYCEDIYIKVDETD